MVTIKDGASVKTKHNLTLVRVSVGKSTAIDRLLVAVDLDKGSQTPRRASYVRNESYWELGDDAPIGIITDTAVQKLKKFSTVELGRFTLTVVM
jgi:hypothetical protein